MIPKVIGKKVDVSGSKRLARKQGRFLSSLTLFLTRLGFDPHVPDTSIVGTQQWAEARAVPPTLPLCQEETHKHLQGVLKLQAKVRCRSYPSNLRRRVKCDGVQPECGTCKVYKVRSRPPHPI